MHDVYAKIEELEGTVEAAEKALGKAERVLTVADEMHERSRCRRGPCAVGARHRRDHRRGAGAAPPSISVTDRCPSEPDRVHDGS